MVTLQDISLQFTKPVKELAEWNYPFSRTLETYCSLFNTTCNTSFGEAGLVLQNSTAVYVHRVDCLWNKTEYFRHIFSNYEHEEVAKNPIKKRDRKTDINLHDFKIINFNKEVEKNIDIKKNHMMQETVKSKSRRFTQLERGIAQHIPIDIYDVNGDIIGKKYDFRCNQNISMDGILVDEFAPQDFRCGGDNSIQERSSSTSSDYSHVTESLECSLNTLTADSAIHDDSDENTNSDAEKNNDNSPVEISDLVSSFTSNQNLSLSRNTDNDTFTDASPDTSTDNCHDLTSTDTNEIDANTPSNTSSLTYNSTAVDSTVLSNNNDSDAKCLNNNISKSENDGIHVLNSPPESIYSQEERTPSIGDTVLLEDTDEDPWKTKLYRNRIQNTPSTGSPRRKSQLRCKSTPKLRKQSPIAITLKRKRRVAKNLLNEFRKKNLACNLEESMSSQRDRSNMFQANLSTCIKYIRQYDPLEYDDVTNSALDFLGYRLRVSEPDTNMNGNVTTTSTDDEMPEFHSSGLISPSHENFCDAWFRSESPRFSPENIDKWHELMQPKLREAEQRSAFCIRDYASRIMESLQTSDQRKINFDEVIQKERACEVARYFLASLDLASRQNVDINTDKNLEHNIEIVLHEEDGQCLSNGQADSHD